ncbi:hypothetical protein PIB30_098867, partial [Stylosanthes scabra]|nr:hypothetical protein [Stylosanthes scabra]
SSHFLCCFICVGHFLNETRNVTTKDVHQSLRKQLMEEAYSYDQGYTPWNFPSYQYHAPRYNAYQSNGYSDAYYGYEYSSPPYPDTHLLKLASKKLFSCYVRKGESFEKPKKESTIK